MLLKLLKLGSIILFASLVTACSSTKLYHDNFMRGQVVEVNNNEAVLCIGSSDEKLQGKTLDVYRVVYLTGAINEGEDAYRRDFIGEVQVGEVINEHFARARINSGSIKKHDIVEFK